MSTFCKHVLLYIQIGHGISEMQQSAKVCISLGQNAEDQRNFIYTNKLFSVFGFSDVPSSPQVTKMLNVKILLANNKQILSV